MCCLLLVCFAYVKERVGVVVRVQLLCTDSHPYSQFRGGGAVDLPDVWLQVIRDACPKSEHWSRMSVTRQQQSTLGHRRIVHVGFPCSASRPSTNPDNCRCVCPSHLDTRNYHPLWRLEIIDFFFLWSGVGSVGDLPAAHEVEAEQAFAGLA